MARGLSTKVTDQYVNRAIVSVVESAANTITFQQIQFGVGTFQQVGLEVQEVHFFPNSTTLGLLVAAGDNLLMGLTGRDDLTDLNPSNQALYCQVGLGCASAQTAPIETPLIYKFADMGGLLIPPNPLYLAVQGIGLGAAATVRAIIYYRFIQLTPQQSLEVLQTLIPGNV